MTRGFEHAGDRPIHDGHSDQNVAVGDADGELVSRGWPVAMVQSDTNWRVCAKVTGTVRRLTPPVLGPVGAG
ncbi:hypothetical protein KRMM14A1004_59830 [Krasilnikovia sp. MM14-A1004]